MRKLDALQGIYARAKWCRVYGRSHLRFALRRESRREARGARAAVCAGRIVIVYSSLFRHAFAVPPERSVCVVTMTTS